MIGGAPSGGLEAAFLVCALGLLAMTVPGFVLYRRFLGDLRTRHPAEWERLGRPTVVYYASQRDRRALQRWLADGGFETLGDAGFAASCRLYRRYGRLYGAAFAGLWILFGVIVGARWLGG